MARVVAVTIGRQFAAVNQVVPVDSAGLDDDVIVIEPTGFGQSPFGTSPFGR